MDILQPAPGATKMGHLKRAVRVTGFVIKWGAHLATLAAGVWMLHGMIVIIVIKIQADKKTLHHNHIKKREGKEEMEEMSECVCVNVYFSGEGGAIQKFHLVIYRFFRSIELTSHII
jgi:hypothetical protein